MKISVLKVYRWFDNSFNTINFKLPMDLANKQGRNNNTSFHFCVSDAGILPVCHNCK